MTKRYESITVVQNNLKKRYYINNIYPDILPTPDDIYVIPVIGDRLDLLANDYYGDSTLYWIIASANSLSGDSLVPPIGQQLRIPTDIAAILKHYNSINTLR